jgi:hypothetical protein
MKSRIFQIFLFLLSFSILYFSGNNANDVSLNSKVDVQRKISSHATRTIASEKNLDKPLIQMPSVKNDHQMNKVESKSFSKLKQKYKLTGIELIGGERYFSSDLVFISKKNYDESMGNIIEDKYGYIIFEPKKLDSNLATPLFIDSLTEEPAFMTGKIFIDYTDSSIIEIDNALSGIGLSINFKHELINKVEIKVEKVNVLSTVKELVSHFSPEMVKPEIITGEYVVY